MNYTIATLEQPNCDILQLSFGKSGNEYAVRLYNKVTKELTTKKFKDIEQAINKFNTLSAFIIKGLYSEIEKREILLED